VLGAALALVDLGGWVVEILGRQRRLRQGVEPRLALIERGLERQAHLHALACVSQGSGPAPGPELSNLANFCLVALRHLFLSENLQRDARPYLGTEREVQPHVR
jgi:hypothetical protein